MLMADGLRVGVGADFGVKPSASVFATGFPCQRQPPLAESLLEFAFFQFSQVAHFFYAECMKMTLHDFAHARDFAHVERGEKFRLLPGDDHEHTVWLGLS